MPTFLIVLRIELAVSYEPSWNMIFYNLFKSSMMQAYIRIIFFNRDVTCEWVAFIKAAKAIYDLVMFFVRNAQRIGDIVTRINKVKLGKKTNLDKVLGALGGG